MTTDSIATCLITALYMISFMASLYFVERAIRNAGREIAQAIRGKSVSAQAAALVHHAQELAKEAQKPVVAFSKANAEGMSEETFCSGLLQLHVWSTPQGADAGPAYCVRCGYQEGQANGQA